MGFSIRKVIRYEGEPGTLFDGLWVDVVQVRHGDVWTLLNETRHWIDLHELMAPYVVGWNVEGTTIEDVERDAVGKVVPARTAQTVRMSELPPPAEAGPDVFPKIDLEVKAWILLKLRESILWREPDPEKKETPPSGNAPAGTPDETAAKSSTSRKSRRARTSSGDPSGST